MTFAKSQAEGKLLLTDVEEEKLQELLASLHSATQETPDGHVGWNFGISAIDKITHTFRSQQMGQPSPPVIEITSNAPACGKTHLLYLLSAQAILPNAEISSESNIGKDPATVVVYDTDGRFDVARLREIMLSRVRKSVSERSNTGNPPQKVVEDALKHMHIFRPKSLSALVDSVQNLPRYLLNFCDHFSANKSLDLVLIDSISAFFWQQNWAKDVEDQEEGESTSKATKNYHALVVGLRELRRLFLCAVVVTHWGLKPNRRKSSGKSSSFHSLLPLSWQSLCTMRLVVQKDLVKRFPLGMDVGQASREALDRQRIVEQGQFSGWADPLHGANWDDGTCQEQLAAPAESSFFKFFIGQDSVVFGL